MSVEARLRVRMVSCVRRAWLHSFSIVLVALQLCAPPELGCTYFQGRLLYHWLNRCSSCTARFADKSEACPRRLHLSHATLQRPAERPATGIRTRTCRHPHRISHPRSNNKHLRQQAPPSSNTGTFVLDDKPRRSRQQALSSNNKHLVQQQLLPPSTTSTLVPDDQPYRPRNQVYSPRDNKHIRPRQPTYTSSTRCASCSPTATNATTSETRPACAARQSGLGSHAWKENHTTRSKSKTPSANRVSSLRERGTISGPVRWLRLRLDARHGHQHGKIGILMRST